MLLPTLFLLFVVVIKCLFLLSQPLGIIVMELFQTFIKCCPNGRAWSKLSAIAGESALLFGMIQAISV